MFLPRLIAASMLLLTLLALNVSRLRMKLRIGNGDGNNVEMKKAIRAHMNHLEHALPFGLIVLALAQMGSATSLLAVLVVGFVAARLVHASGISQAISTSACDAVFHAIRHARANGVLVSYDTNLRLALWPLDRARAVIHAAAALADILLPGLDDAKALTGRERPASSPLPSLPRAPVITSA